jgi:L-fuconolactonase
MEKIDAHQHFWDLDRFRYAWMGPNAPATLHRNCLPGELQPQLQAAGVTCAVLVQADGSVPETDWFFELAKQYPSIQGVVGWVDLEAPDFPDILAGLAANPLYKGIRPYFENVKDFETIRPALALLDHYHLSCDLLTGPDFLFSKLWMARDYPNITYIYDHLAQGAQIPGGIPAWKDLLQPAAALPNVFMKVSGYLTALHGKPLTVETLRPYLDTALELFGPERLLFGSDWPICTQSGSYQQTVDVLTIATADLSLSEQAELWAGSARRAYKL